MWIPILSFIIILCHLFDCSHQTKCFSGYVAMEGGYNGVSPPPTQEFTSVDYSADKSLVLACGYSRDSTYVTINNNQFQAY